MIIENEHNAYFIHRNYLVAKTSSPDENPQNVNSVLIHVFFIANKQEKEKNLIFIVRGNLESKEVNLS